MDQITLHATRRDEAGSRLARRLRRAGSIPAVVYGRDVDAIPIAVDQRDLYAALRTEAGLNALINVEVADGDTILTVAREIQRHPVRGSISHLDFIKVSLDVEIQADVAIHYQGVPIGVREEGGFVETIETTVSVMALPTAIPSSFEISIDHLHMGDTLTLGDLDAIEGVTFVDEPDRPLLTVLAPRLVEEEEEVLEGEELEGEEVEGEEAAEEGEGEAEAEGGEEG